MVKAGCVKRIEDFYLEEVITYWLKQHLMDLEESDRWLLAEDDVRKYGRMKMHEIFPATELTPELMDEYVERVDVVSAADV